MQGISRTKLKQVWVKTHPLPTKQQSIKEDAAFKLSVYSPYL